MARTKRPNIVYIYADDLGHGMLSCYGQRHYRTPNIDRIADDGARFNRAYGTAFCAPARACLLRGQHDAHAGRWTFCLGGIYNRHTDGQYSLDEVAELVHNTGITPGPDDPHLARLARQAGYTTAQIGKLEWGFATTADQLQRNGWDYHYGYYDHLQCHGFYPPYVFDNGRKVPIDGNTRDDFGVGPHHMFPEGTNEHDPAGRAVYSQDLFDQAIVRFLRDHRDQPFFLYHPSQLPHGPIYFPDLDPQVADNPDLTPVEKEYASMVLRLDRTVGLVLDQLDALGLAQNTLVIFASDNGHHLYYNQPGRSQGHLTLDGQPIDNHHTAFTTQTCGDVFDGNGGLAGLKTTNWEGGCRIPMLVRWPAAIQAGQISEQLVSNYDTMATLAEALGIAPPDDTDGLSYLPALTGRHDAPEHDHVVYASQFGPCLVTRDRWKLRVWLRPEAILDYSTFGQPLAELADAFEAQLYNLADDPTEQHDLAADRPELAGELKRRLLAECDGNFVHGTPQAHFAFYPEPDHYLWPTDKAPEPSPRQ